MYFHESRITYGIHLFYKRCIKDYDGGKCVTLIPANEEGINLMKKYEEFWNEFKRLTELKNNNSYNLCVCGDNYLKNKIILIMIYL